MDNVQAVIRTPYQGLNKLLGPEGGFLPGTMVLVTSPQDNYRCGLLLDILLGDLLYGETATNDIIMNVTPHVNEHTYMHELARRYTYATEDQRLTNFNKLNLHNEIYSREGGETKITIYDIMELVTAREREGIDIRMLIIGDLTQIRSVDANGHLTAISNLVQELRKFISTRQTVLITSFPDGNNLRITDKWFDGMGSDVGRLSYDVDCVIKVMNYTEGMKFTVPKYRGTTPQDVQVTYTSLPDELPTFDITGEDASTLHRPYTTSVAAHAMCESYNPSELDTSKALDIGDVFSGFLRIEENEPEVTVTTDIKTRSDLELELINTMNSDAVRTYIDMSVDEVIDLLKLYGASRYGVFVKNSYILLEHDSCDGSSLEIVSLGNRVCFNNGTIMEFFLALDITPEIRLEFMVNVIAALVTLAAVTGTKKYLFNE